MQPAQHGFTPAPGVQISVSESFRVTFTGDSIEITGWITDPEQADEMINAIRALKLLLRPIGSSSKPSLPQDDK